MEYALLPKNVYYSCDNVLTFISNNVNCVISDTINESIFYGIKIYTLKVINSINKSISLIVLYVIFLFLLLITLIYAFFSCFKYMHNCMSCDNCNKYRYNGYASIQSRFTDIETDATAIIPMN